LYNSTQVLYKYCTIKSAWKIVSLVDREDRTGDEKLPKQIVSSYRLPSGARLHLAMMADCQAFLNREVRKARKD